MHGAAVQHHDVVNDRKAEARAALHALSIAAEETLEEIGLLGRRHAGAVVLDDDFSRRRAVRGCRARHVERDPRALGPP